MTGMTNREQIEAILQKDGLRVGCYDTQVESIDAEGMNELLIQMMYGSCDVQITLNNQPYVVEVFHMCCSVDFSLISAEDYALQYGRVVGE